MIFKQIWSGRNITGSSKAFPAEVPGNIQYDYGKAHGFGDVNYSDNYKQYLSLEDDTWEYSASLSYEKNEGERVFFVSGGIDYRYEVRLNGKTVYSYEGMFRPFEIDITDALTGNDTLSVVIFPHPKSKNGRAGTRDEADASCKPPVCYGWDWNPRLLISGMWQDAYIETRGKGYISAPEARTGLDDTLTTGRLDLSFDCELPCECALYDREGNLVVRGSETSFTVNSPKLWWCNGQGEPYLYRWEIKNAYESRSGLVGFRRIRLVRNEGAGDPKTFPKTRYAPPATIELNGRRIFAKGTNWVNPDLFGGRVSRENYDELLTLARDAHMNTLRVWGGASVCKDDFYELCDRYGLLVWQEFMLACNNYLPTDNYMKVLESEASAILRRLRSHPSIALWCGGNELFNTWSGMDDQSLPLRLLNKLCFEYDRDTPFIPTSPLMGMAHGGYMFYMPAQNGEVFEEFAKARNTAYSEFGVPSLSSAETLRAIIPEDELFPIKKTRSWVAHHGFDAWLTECWTCLDTYKKYFGEPRSLDEACRNSALLQSVGYKAAFEEARRQSPHCSMALNWCFNEPWSTAGNNSLVEYPAAPKPSYFAVRDSLRPLVFSAKIPRFVWRSGDTFEAEIWLLNDSQASAELQVEITLTIGERRLHLLDWKASAEAAKNTQGPTARLVLPQVPDAALMTLTLKASNGEENSYTLKYSCPAHEEVSKKKTMNL